MCTGNASGLFSKKQHAASAAQRFMGKLCTERWREWTRLALFLSSSLMHSIILYTACAVSSFVPRNACRTRPQGSSWPDVPCWKRGNSAWSCGMSQNGGTAGWSWFCSWPFALCGFSFVYILRLWGRYGEFLVNSASKFLQNSSNTQNVSVTLSAVIIAVYVCKLLIFQL